VTTRVLGRVDPSRLASLALTAAVLGLFAGIVGATFATIAGEPSLEDAIAIEAANAISDHDAASADGHGDDGADVSRSTQRGVGLFGAYALTGAAFGAITAVVAFVLRREGSSAARRVLLAGVMLGGALTVAPWFKYPPNPPGVGDPDTLGDRQRLYALLIAIAIAVGVAAVQVARTTLARGWTSNQRLAAVAGVVAVPLLVAYAVMPPAPDAIEVPATLVWRFRVASLGSNLTVWTVLTLGLSWVVAEADRRRGGREHDVAYAGAEA